MTVMHVNRNKHTLPISNQPLVLRNGQIVQGEILKIYPDNKAEIRIGTHRFIAETNTPLVIGKRYFFQVSGLRIQIFLHRKCRKLLQRPSWFRGVNLHLYHIPDC